MVTPEARVKNAIDQWIKVNLPGVFVYKPRGGPFGVAGTPDYFICWHGVFIGIEAKREDTDPRPLQRAALRRIAAAGGIAAVIRGNQLNRLETIRQEVLKRVQLGKLQVASSGGSDSVCSSEDDDGIRP